MLCWLVDQLDSQQVHHSNPSCQAPSSVENAFVLQKLTLSLFNFLVPRKSEVHSEKCYLHVSKNESELKFL